MTYKEISSKQIEGIDAVSSFEPETKVVLVQKISDEEYEKRVTGVDTSSVENSKNLITSGAVHSHASDDERHLSSYERRLFENSVITEIEGKRSEVKMENNNVVCINNDEQYVGNQGTIWIRISPTYNGYYRVKKVKKIRIKAATNVVEQEQLRLMVVDTTGAKLYSDDVFSLVDGWYEWVFDNGDLSTAAMDGSWLAFLFKKPQCPITDTGWTSQTANLNCSYVLGGDTTLGESSDGFNSGLGKMPIVQIVCSGEEYASQEDLEEHIENNAVHLSTEQAQKIDNALTSDDITDVLRTSDVVDIIEDSEKPVKSGAVYEHTSDTNIHFESAAEHQCVKDHIASTTKHLTEGQVETLNILADITAIDEEPTENSLNVASSGGIWKSNEYLNGEEIFEDWLEGKQTQNPQRGHLALFSYKPITDIFVNKTFEKVEVKIEISDEQRIRLVAFDIFNDSDRGFNENNISFLGISDEQTITGGTYSFKFKPFNAKSGNLLFAFVDSDEGYELFKNGGVYRLGIPSQSTEPVHKVLRYQKVLVCGEEGGETGNYRYWSEPWDTSNMSGPTGKMAVPLKFRTIPHKFNTNIHLTPNQVQKIDNALTSSDITDVLRTTDVVDIVKSSESPVKSGAVYTHTSNDSLHFTGTEKEDLVTAKNHVGASDLHFDSSTQKTNVLTATNAITTHISNNDIHVTAQEKTDIAKIANHIKDGTIHHTADEIGTIVDDKMSGYVTTDTFNGHTSDDGRHLTAKDRTKLEDAVVWEELCSFVTTATLVAHVESGLHFASTDERTCVINHVSESECFYNYHLKSGDRAKIDGAIDQDALDEALESYTPLTSFTDHKEAECIHFTDATQKVDVINHISNKGTYKHLSSSDVETIVDGKLTGYVTTGTFNAHAEAECIHFTDKDEKDKVTQHVEANCIHHTTDEIEEIVAGKMSDYALAKELTDHIGDDDVHFTGSEKSTMQKDITDLKSHANDGTIHHTQSDIENIVDGKMSGYVTTGTFEGHTGNTNVHFTGETEKKSVIDHVSFESGCFYNYHLKDGDRAKIEGAITQDDLKGYVTTGTFNDHVGDTTHLTADDRKKLNNAVEASELLNYVTETDFNNHVGDTTHLSTADRTKLNNAIDSSYLNGYVTAATFNAHAEAKCLHFEYSCQKTRAINHTNPQDSNFYTYHLKDGDRNKIDTAVDQGTLDATLEEYVAASTFNSHVENSTHLSTADRAKLDTAVSSIEISNIACMTQEDYDSLATKEANTFYIISEG